MHVLGIDAGGTKTVCLLAGERGIIVSEGRGPGANLHAAGELAVEQVLGDVIAAAIGGRVVSPAAVCLGIAGVDRDDELRTLQAVMRRILHDVFPRSMMSPRLLSTAKSSSTVPTTRPSGSATTA